MSWYEDHAGFDRVEDFEDLDDDREMSLPDLSGDWDDEEYQEGGIIA